MDFWETFWLALGIILILAEIILPGGTAFFIGVSAAIVALLHFLGLISSPLTGFSVWFILSILLLFALKGVVDQFLPHQKSKSNTDEDLDAFGKEVVVLEEIKNGEVGRISFQGSVWPAKSKSGCSLISKGDKVKLIFRENMTWIVEPIKSNKD